jgi:hypothetical protein
LRSASSPKRSARSSSRSRTGRTWRVSRLLLKVQSGQLELQRQQTEDQRQANARQAEVLGLQAAELRESLEQRQRDAYEQRQSQAARVTAWFAMDPQAAVSGPWGAVIRNASNLPIVDVRVFFHYVAEKWPGGDWEPVLRGTPVEKVRVISPQADRFYKIPEQIRTMMDQVDDTLYVVSIEFTDAAGNRWERDPRGTLTPRSLRLASKPSSPRISRRPGHTHGTIETCWQCGTSAPRECGTSGECGTWASEVASTSPTIWPPR